MTHAVESMDRQQMSASQCYYRMHETTGFIVEDLELLRIRAAWLAKDNPELGPLGLDPANEADALRLFFSTHHATQELQENAAEWGLRVTHSPRQRLETLDGIALLETGPDDTPDGE